MRGGKHRAKLQELSAEECLRLLATARGPLVYSDDPGPVAVPVNYALSGDNVVIRVEGGTKYGPAEVTRRCETSCSCRQSGRFLRPLEN